MTIDQVDEGVRAATRPLNSARHLPGYIYASREVYAMEKEKIFMAEWLCVAREEELEQPWKPFRCHVTDEPLLLLRDRAGHLRALRNVCSRCTEELVAVDEEPEELVCPVDRTAHRLDQLDAIALDTWQGWVFVNFADAPPPFSDFIAIADRDFGFLRQGECRLGDKLVADLDCNWKLAVENLADIYHLKVLHYKSNGRRFTPEGVQIDLKSEGNYTLLYDSGPSTPDNRPHLPKMEWIADKPDEFSINTFLPPNVHLFGRIDNVHPFTIWPTSHQTCRMICYHLFPKPYFELPGFAEQARTYGAWVNLTLEEDRQMIASLQNAMSSKRFIPGPMSSLEKLVHHIINGYLEKTIG
jgi:Rieske 2Fe-2S family protein